MPVLCPLDPHALARAVALETTLLVHGVPRESAPGLAAELTAIVREEGAEPAVVGVHAGRPIVGMTDAQVRDLLEAPSVPKANTANLGACLFRASHAATTVATTLELAAQAGVRLFATGALGGVHRNFAQHLDISGDLQALVRFPVAVVSAGVKGLLDVQATREALETLGIPVVGFQTDRFPAFYLRDGGAGVDARFDDVDELAGFIDFELDRSGRGLVIANPIAEQDAIPQDQWSHWLAQAVEAAGNSATGRDATPQILGHLHRLSNGKTLAANIALVKSNARLAARLASRLSRIG